MTDKDDESVCPSDVSNEITFTSIFLARIVTVDHYLSHPSTEYDSCYSDFRGSEIHQVPILQVFGITPAGQKCCLHVHGVFPYLVIICDETMPQNETDADFRKFAQELAISIDKALNASTRNSCHHVYKIAFFSGIPFYGYHGSSQAFLKIYFYNPNVIRKVAELLSTGVIMNKVIQPYEAHIPYILQFFIDYNLFGMNLINLSNWTFRVSNAEDDDESDQISYLPSTSSQGATGGHRIWNIAQIDNSRLCSSLRRHTCCELEIDCTAADIQNLSQGQSCLGKNPGLQSIWQEECRRLGRLTTSEILPSCSNDRSEVFESDSEVFYRKRLNEMLTRYNDVSSVSVVDGDIACSSASSNIIESNQATGDTSLCDSQDYEMLNMFLSMVNDTTDNPDHDSILSFHTVRNAEMDEDEAAQTMEMSQCFMDDYDMSLEMERTGCRPKHSPLQVSPETTNRLPIIPQLDGTGDDDKLKLVAKRSDVLIAPKQVTESKNVSSFSPMTATQERLISVEPIIKIELESEDELSYAKQSAIWDHYKERHRHKSLPCRKGKKNGIDAVNNSTIPPAGMLASSSVAHSSCTKNSVSRRCSFDSSSEKKITRLTSRRTRAQKKRSSSFNCSYEKIKTGKDQVDTDLPELIRNIDMKKIGHEVVLVKRLSESEVNRILKSKKKKPESIAIPNNTGQSDCFESKKSDLDVSPSGSIPKSPSLKMKFKLKRISTRSNDSHFVVVDKEFTEFIEDPEPKKPIKLKLKCCRNNCSSDQTTECKNFVIDSVPPPRYSHKRHLPLAKKLAECPQNKNQCFKSPMLIDEGLSLPSTQKSGRKLRSHTIKSDCEISEVKHPADIQKERLSKLNLILTRNEHDSFNCIKSVDKPQLSNDSHKKSKKKKTSPQKYSQVLDIQPAVHQNITSHSSQNDSETHEIVFSNQRLPKLHLKLGTKDHWTRCKSESETEMSYERRSKSPRKKSRRRRKSHHKTTKNDLPHCSPTKNTSLKIDKAFDVEVVVSHESREQELKKLCKPFSITLRKLPGDTLAKYSVLRKSQPEMINYQVSEYSEDIESLNKVPAIKSNHTKNNNKNVVKMLNVAEINNHLANEVPNHTSELLNAMPELSIENVNEPFENIETLNELPMKEKPVLECSEDAGKLLSEVPSIEFQCLTDVSDDVIDLPREVTARINCSSTEHLVGVMSNENPEESRRLIDLAKDATLIKEEEPANGKPNMTDLLEITTILVNEKSQELDHQASEVSDDMIESPIRNPVGTDFPEVAIGMPNKLFSPTMAMEESSQDSVASFSLMEDKSPNSKSDDLEACFSDTSPMPSKEDTAFRSSNSSARFIPKVSQDNDDVMWNLAYFSPTEKIHHFDTPPRCWSPSLDVECVKEVKKSETQFPNRIEIKEEPLDCSNNEPSTSDSPPKKCEELKVKDDEESFYDFFTQNDPNEISNSFTSQNANVNIKQEIFTDSNDNFNSFGDLFGSPPSFPFQVENTNSNQMAHSFSRQNDFEVRIKSPFDISSELQHDDMLESYFDDHKNKPNPYIKPSENYKNSLLYDSLSGERHDTDDNSIKLEKNIQDKNACSLINAQSSQEKDDIFSVLPSTELSFYSTLDDDIIPIGSPMTPLKKEGTCSLNIFNIKEEQNDSCDLFGSDGAGVSIPQNSYENISSSSECYMTDYLGNMKSSIISDHCSSSTKSLENKDNSSLKGLINNFSENPYSAPMHNNPFRANSISTPTSTKDFLPSPELCVQNVSLWQDCHMNGSNYSGSNNMMAPHVDNIFQPSTNSIFQHSFSPIASSLLQKKSCTATTSDNRQRAYSHNDMSAQQKAIQNLSKAPNCVLKICKVEKPDPLLDKKFEITPLRENTFSANMFIGKSSCENVQVISPPAFSAPTSIGSNWNVSSNILDKRNKSPSLLPNLLSAPPIIKLESPFEDDFLQSSKPTAPSADNEDILSKIVKSCNIDMEFDFGNNYMKNQRENEGSFFEIDKDSAQVVSAQACAAFTPDAMSNALKVQKMNFGSQQRFSSPSPAGTYFPSQPSNSVISQNLNSSMKDFHKGGLDNTFLSSFDNGIQSFYGYDSIDEGNTTLNSEISSPCRLYKKALPSSTPLSCSDSTLKTGSKKNSKQAKTTIKSNTSLSAVIHQPDPIFCNTAPSLGTRKSSWMPSIKAPSRDEIKFMQVKHLDAFYSEATDCQPPAVSHFGPKDKAGNQLDIPNFESHFYRPSNHLAHLNLEKQAKNNSCYQALLAQNNNVVLTPSNFSPSSADVRLWLGKHIKPQLLNEPAVNTGKISLNKKKSVLDTPCSTQAAKYSMLTKLLESPIIKTNNFDRGRQSLVPASSTPLSSGFNRVCKKEPEEVQEGAVSGTSGASSTAWSFSIRKRKLSFTETTAPKVIKLERLSPKPQYLLPTSSLNSTSSQIEGPTLENSGAFKINLGNQDFSKSHEFQYLTVMSIEIHINTRNSLCPDPECDPVAMVFFCISKDDEKHENRVGVIVVDDLLRQEDFYKGTSIKKELLATPEICHDLLFCVCDEKQLFEKLKTIIRAFDPDILLGYEIEKLSLGYLFKRASFLNVDLCSKLSRLLELRTHAKPQSNNNRDGDDHSDLHIVGRIVLNLWRVMRKELSLNIYTFENVYYHVLHQRVPRFSFETLTTWYCSRQQPLKHKIMQYYILRVTGNIQLMEKLDIIQRTSELARVFGIQFYEVLSRGSQFRVESMMLRYAKPLNYIPISPTIRQRSMSRAPECVPLVFEPESKFYVDPVVVLDFQSLYPSMMIAYNYCFSTCLGRVDNFCKVLPYEFGCCSLSITTDQLRDLKDSIHIGPTGVAFVKSNIRQGILPSMLSDILNTRILVKQSLKLNKDNKFLSRLLEARQLGLKLIANVTYGYTSANFSGRMPCVEIADSIVAKGRETLERAIQVIENSDKWKAKVVYGDTDSVFILLTGRTKEQAFQIGQEIADVITALNPKPVKLKFEKVYFPCVLQSKKRYVGYMYESVDQSKPTFDAKGIETVRRDSCAAVSKMLEKSLKILFNTKDISLVKKYVQKQFGKILSGRMNMMDCIFAKEYRGRSGYRPVACVPALEIAKKRILKDSQSEPLVGERVPYVVVYGSPGLSIIQLVREPGELLDDPSLRLNAKYYITRVISPPLDRVLSLIKADVKEWYERMSHTHVPTLPMVPVTNRPRSTLSQYFTALSCPSCEKTTNFGLCPSCQQDCQTTAIILNNKIKNWERTFHHLNEICTSCTKNRSCGDLCVSLDCPILYRRSQARRDLAQAPYLRNILLHELF